MAGFNQIPSWDAMHPLIVHFPIALLMASPLFLAISAAVKPEKSRPWLVGALLLLAAGTVSIFAAASSGKEAAELADRSEAVNAVLAQHEHLAAECEVVFTTFSLALGALIVWSWRRRRDLNRMISTVVPVLFLASYMGGLVFLVGAAHAGGRLVHEFGLHALMPGSGTQSLGPESPGGSGREE